MVKIKSGSSVDITPAQFKSQWAGVINKISANTWNFQVVLSKKVEEIFKQSFVMGRFNSSGSQYWHRRTKSYPHPILNETGTLRESIKRKFVGTGVDKHVSIFTDPTAFKTSARHQGFCYAAVHNAPDGTYYYGASKVPSVQRQFIGHSSLVEEELKNLSDIIFQGLP